MDGGARRATVPGVSESQTRLGAHWNSNVCVCVCVCVCVSSNLAVHADAHMPILHVWVSLPALQKGASVPFS